MQEEISNETNHQRSQSILRVYVNWSFPTVAHGNLEYFEENKLRPCASKERRHMSSTYHSQVH